MSEKPCAACGHAPAFHRIGTGSGVPVGQEYCDDRHAAPCACRGFVRPVAPSSQTLTLEQIDCIRRTGHVVRHDVSVPIGLSELDALCATARLGVEAKDPHGFGAAFERGQKNHAIQERDEARKERDDYQKLAAENNRKHVQCNKERDMALDRIYSLEKKLEAAENKQYGMLEELRAALASDTLWSWPGTVQKVMDMRHTLAKTSLERDSAVRMRDAIQKDANVTLEQRRVAEAALAEARLAPGDYEGYLTGVTVVTVDYPEPRAYRSPHTGAVTFVRELRAPSVTLDIAVAPGQNRKVTFVLDAVAREVLSDIPPDPDKDLVARNEDLSRQLDAALAEKHAMSAERDHTREQFAEFEARVREIACDANTLHGKVADARKQNGKS